MKILISVRSSYCFFAIVMGLGFAFYGNTLLAQENSGRLMGAVTNADNTMLSGVRIVLKHIPTQTTYQAISNSTGSYCVPFLRAGGKYQISAIFNDNLSHLAVLDTISINGMGRSIFNIRMGMKPDTTLTLHYRVKTNKKDALSQTFGEQSMITSEMVERIPSIGRALGDYLRLIPEYLENGSFGGLNYRYNNVMIDGIADNDVMGQLATYRGKYQYTGSSVQNARANMLSPNVIQEIGVDGAPSDIRQSNFVGASINLITKSGSNKVSAEGYGSGTNASFSGPATYSNYLRMPKGYQHGTLGYSVGFPIVKNKLFMFSNAEYNGEQVPIFESAGSGPTASIVSADDATLINQTVGTRYGIDSSSVAKVILASKAHSFFNKIDWNLGLNHQLVLRNQTVYAYADYLEQTPVAFKFANSMYRNYSFNTSTTIDWKSKWSSKIFSDLQIAYGQSQDYKKPSANSYTPLVQVVGNTPATRILLGTDPDAAIYNSKVRYFQFSENINVVFKNHFITAGTQNEYHQVSYSDVKNWNGTVNFNSVADLVSGNEASASGNFSYSDNNRNRLFLHPFTPFGVALLSAYVQDEIQLTHRFGISPGLRIDYSFITNRPRVSEQIAGAPTDRYFGNSYEYEPLNKLRNRYLGRAQASPRVGFVFDVFEDHRLVFKGGLGLFTARMPLGLIAQAFTFSGQRVGNFSFNAPFVSGTDPLQPKNSNGISVFAQTQGISTNDPLTGRRQVDVIADGFTMPKVLKTHIVAGYTTKGGYVFQVTGIYSKNIKDNFFQRINGVDSVAYFANDRAKNLQPIYPSTAQQGSRFSDVYELSNAFKGYGYALSAQIAKTYENRWRLMASYTYVHAVDVTSNEANTFEDNYRTNPALQPNNPGAANSNFDVRHRIKSWISYQTKGGKRGQMFLSLFFSAHSGYPFTYGLVNGNVQNSGQNLNLVYIPRQEEAFHFFQAINTSGGTGISAYSQAQAFNAFIDGNGFLKNKRGLYTQRNEFFTPWSLQSDFRLMEVLKINKLKKQSVSFTLDIINLGSLLNQHWGNSYYVSSEYNHVANIGLAIPHSNQQNDATYPIYSFNTPGKPYTTDPYTSRYQVQLGFNYTF